MRKAAAIILVIAGMGHARADEIAASAQAAISHYRHEHGLGAVTLDPKLMSLAEEQAHAMARTGIMDHSVYKPFPARMASYNPELAVENIAAGTTSFASTLDLWEHSPGHNANLLKAGATHFGIAVAKTELPQSRYKVFWSLIMARPTPPSPPHRPGRPGHPGKPIHAAPAVAWGAPVEEPLVPVRAVGGKQTASADAKDGSPGLLSGISGTLSHLFGGKDAGSKGQ